METTVNSRILLLKTQSNMDVKAFTTATKMSPTTLWNIQNGGDLKPKTIKQVAEAFNVNIEWLLTGKGEMHREVKEEINHVSLLDRALKKLEDQIDKKDQLIENLMSIVMKSDKAGSFLKTLNQKTALKATG